MKLHKLKIYPHYFSEIINCSKTFELRKCDRDYEVGDLLCLEEHDCDTKSRTGRSLIAQVKNILKEFEGLSEGYCIMSIELIRFSRVLLSEEEEID